MITLPNLSNILSAADRNALEQLWATTTAAPEFTPLPSGQYLAHVEGGRLFTAETGTRGFELTFRIAEGEHLGRTVRHRLWLTAAAMPMTKRELARIGINSIAQLDQPVPPSRIRCRIQVVARTSESGEVFNEVRNFKVVAIDDPHPEPFAPEQGGGQ